MDDRGGSFVAVRRISQGFDRGNNCHSSGMFSLLISVLAKLISLRLGINIYVLIFFYLRSNFVEVWICRLKLDHIRSIHAYLH